MSAPSLRGRLTRALLAAVLVIACVQAVVTYRSASAETEALFDAQMQRIALSLSGNLAEGALDGPLAEGPAAAHDMVIQIWRADGLMLYRSPTSRLLPPQALIGFSDVRLGGEPYRVYALQTPRQIVQVAQQTEARRQMAGQVALRAVLPVALLAPLLMLVVWWVVGRALAPVERVRGQVAARRPGDLAPLPTAGLPAELRPLVDDMNGLLARLAAAWDALTHFTADAAHELRSPLAALRLQVQSLQRADDEDARRLAEQRLLGGIDRATRLVGQLLALARQEGAVRDAARGAIGAPTAPFSAVRADLVGATTAADSDRAMSPGVVDLAALVRAAVAEAEPEAERRRIALLPQVDDSLLPLAADADALNVLLRNLVENALHYTPEGGRVYVGARAAGSPPTGASVAELVVEDSGPGIAPADRQRVLDRFYRVPGAPGHGSGLGLAIVRAIADRHGAKLVLDDSPALGGLRVSVLLNGLRVK